MKLEISKFKKISESPHSATLRHPSGHHIVISKKALSKPLLKQLSELPMMCQAPNQSMPQSDPQGLARGGKVRHYAEGEEVEPAPPLDDNQRMAQVTVDDMPAQLNPSDAAANEDVSQAAPVAPQPQAQSAPPQAAPSGLSNFQIPPAQVSSINPAAAQQSNSLAEMQQNFALGAQGITQAANAQAEFAQQKANVLKDQAADYKLLQSNHIPKMMQALDQMEKVVSDMQQGHINPDHYMQSRTGGQKALMAIGAFLSGLGGNGAGALNFINAQIDRDVKAQIANLGQKQSVLSAYMHLFGSYKDGLAMATGVQNMYYANLIEQAAANSQSKLAQANGKTLASNYRNAAIAQISPLIMRQSALELAGSGQIKDPSSLVPVLVPPDRQKEVFTEINNAINATNVEKEMLAAFDQAAKQVPSAVRQAPSVLQMRALGLPMIHDQEGKVNEYEQKTLMDLEPNKMDYAGGDYENRVAQKRAALIHFMRGKQAASTAKGYGIDLQKFKATGRRGMPSPNPSMTAMGQ